jgi:protein PhnA
MASKVELVERSGNKCELCRSSDNLLVFEVQPKSGAVGSAEILACGVCHGLLSSDKVGDTNHWRALSESMWSEFDAVKVMAYRILRKMSDVAWAQDLLGQLYLDDDLQAWAEAELSEIEDDNDPATVDSNGTGLQSGDTVTLIKDLEVKGANFTAKRGTIVKNISLTGDPKFVEGRVNGTVIVLVAAYLKKA